MGPRLSKEQLDEIKDASSFNEKEIQKLFNAFKKVDINKSGGISVDEFLAVPALTHNPLVKRVIEIFDTDKSGEVDFREFVEAIMLLSNNESKLKFAFKMYDSDDDGFISNADLFKLLKIMVGTNLRDEQIQQLVDRTLLKGDKDKDGKLSYSEFCDLVKDMDFSDKLKVEI